MESASTKKSPNELIYGKQLRTALEVSTMPLPMPLSAVPLHELRTVMQEEAATTIEITQRAMTKHYDKKHISLNFSTGYAFLRLGAGYSIPAVRKQKLTQQRVGPFKILKVVGKGKAIGCSLPPTMESILLSQLSTWNQVWLQNQTPIIRLCRLMTRLRWLARRAILNGKLKP